MANESDVDKSERPTDSRLKKAKEKGQIPRSRELTSVIILLVGIMLFWLMGSALVQKLIIIIKTAMQVSFRVNDESRILTNLIELMTAGFWAIVPLFFALAIFAIVAPLCVGGLLFSWQSIKPNFKKLNPISGFGRMFSRRILAELFKSMLKVILITIAASLLLFDLFPVSYTHLQPTRPY